MELLDLRKIHFGSYDHTWDIAVHVVLLINTGTIVEGMWISGVIHETGNITGGIGRLQELCFHIHLIEDKVLLLVPDVDSVYGIGGEGTTGISLIHKVATHKVPKKGSLASPPWSDHFTEKH